MIQDNAAPAKDKGKKRKLVRKKVVELLKGKTDAGAAVFPNSSVPPWHEELPVILIYPRSESASEYATAPRELERDLDLAIEIVATGPEENDELNSPGANKSLEDILDDISEQIENILDVDDSLQGTADSSTLENTEFEYDSSGGQPIGSCRLTYGVTYYTMSPRNIDGQDANNDFTSSNVKYNISEIDENTREAEDTVNQPT